MRSPGEAVAAFAPRLRDRNVECVMGAFLDAEMRVLDIDTVVEGDASAAALPVAVLMRGALARGAVAIVVAHNHPSGDATPSACDIAATRRLATAATALDIELVDHIVISREGSFSFRRGGLL